MDYVFYAIYRILKEAHCGAMCFFRCLVAKVLYTQCTIYAQYKNVHAFL